MAPERRRRVEAAVSASSQTSGLIKERLEQESAHWAFLAQVEPVRLQAEARIGGTILAPR